MTFTRLDIVLMAAVLTVMIIMLWLAGRVTMRLQLEAELKRKVVHVLTGLVSLSFPWLFSSALPVIVMIALSLLTMAALRSPLLKKYSISTVLHDVQRTSYGEFYLLISVGLLFTLSVGQPILYILPLSVIALSDTASALIGTRYGSRHFTVADGLKSLEGSAAFFAVTLLVSLILLMLLTDAPDINVLALSVLVAGFTTAVESDSWKGLDNIFVPVGAHILLFRFLEATPSGLCAAFILLALAVIIMHKAAPILGLIPHTSRAYTLLILLIISPSPNAAVLFPLLALGMHLIARHTDPARNPNRDMEMIGATAAVAMIWLFIDKLIPASTEPFFNLSFAGAAIVFMGVALPGKWRVLTPVFAFGLYLFLARDFSFTLAVSLGLCALIVMLFPQLFATYRAVRVYSVSLIMPLCSLVIGIWL